MLKISIKHTLKVKTILQEPLLRTLFILNRITNKWLHPLESGGEITHPFSNSNYVKLRDTSVLSSHNLLGACLPIPAGIWYHVLLLSCTIRDGTKLRHHSGVLTLAGCRYTKQFWLILLEIFWKIIPPLVRQSRNQFQNQCVCLSQILGNRVFVKPSNHPWKTDLLS